jgi:hypothetical protein
MAGVQKFSDTATGEVPPREGTIDTGSPPTPLTASPGRPSAVQESDGTENKRGETTTKQGGMNSTPTGGTPPQAPDRYDGETVRKV